MFYKAIVCYLDILGYQDLVTQVMGREEFVAKLEKLLFRTSVESHENLSRMPLEDIVQGGPREEERYHNLVKNIRVRNIADNFIFTLPVPEVSKHDQDTQALIESYFLFITMVIVHFMAQMGHLLRGGISIGNHYENERKHHLFVFSEAHNRAVKLENKKANNPRIIMDEHLQQYFEQVSYPYTDRLFYKDEDDSYCLDIYYSICLWGSRTEEILKHVKNAIELCIEKNFNRHKELSKLIHFAKFHNRKVTRSMVNLPHLAFDVEKYEEQLRHLKPQ